jgi:SAM-dependent methyltransferase
MAQEPETTTDLGKNGMDENAAIRDGWTARAETYAAYAVPKNRPFAIHLVQLLAPQPGERLLDIATGPGVVAVEAARTMGVAGEVVATDIAPVWERWVNEAAQDAHVGNVSFAAMPADALALPDAAFDVVACQFGLMFVPEPSAALREMRRVLRPGGRLGIAVWSTSDRVAHFGSMAALRAALPPEPPKPGEPTPLSLSEPGLIERLTEEAGFVDVRAHKHAETFFLDSAESEWRRLQEDPAFAPKLDTLTTEARAAAREAVIAAVEQFRYGDRFAMPSEAIIVIARNPA